LPWSTEPELPNLNYPDSTRRALQAHRITMPSETVPVLPTIAFNK